MGDILSYMQSISERQLPFLEARKSVTQEFLRRQKMTKHVFGNVKLKSTKTSHRTKIPPTNILSLTCSADFGRSQLVLLKVISKL